MKKKYKQSLAAHKRQLTRYSQLYATDDKESEFAKLHYHFHIIDNMQKKRRILTKKEKREIFRIKTDPRYR